MDSSTPACAVCGASLKLRRQYALGTNRKYCDLPMRCRHLAESLSRFSGELFRKRHSQEVIDTIIGRLVAASQTQEGK